MNPPETDTSLWSVSRPDWDVRHCTDANERAREARYRSFLLVALLLQIVSVPRATAAEIDVSKLPAPASVQVVFDRDIKPIFEKACLRCHGPERPKSHFRLDSREAALKGGDNGVDIIPGQSAKSPLIHYVARLVEDLEMPPEGKGEPLTPEQVGLLRAWIDQGVKWSAAPSSDSKVTFSMTPSIRWIAVNGDRRQFREHAWMEEGWAGGFQEFKLQQKLGEGETFSSEGRLFFNGHDYQIKMSLDKQEFGFARFGFEQFRRYYDDTGGYYEPFATNSFSLGRDLFVDVGRVWTEFGLTLPDRPRLVLGYEYQFKEGAKSMIQWSDVYNSAFDTAAIYPSFKEIEERVHTLKFDASHEINGVLLEDNFRAEFYDLSTRQAQTDGFALGDAVPGPGRRFSDRQEHFQAVNTFRLEKQLRDWLFLSGGYLYSKLDGDARFRLELPDFTSPERPLVAIEQSDQIILDRRSHVFNFNTALGPWEGLSLVGGVQSEWTREEGLGNALVSFPGANPDPQLYSTYRDKALVEENFGMRYTKLPFTVLFAEARFQQEGIDHFERQMIGREFDSPDDFLRDTDARSDLKEYRAGFTISPWTRVSLHSSYKRRLKQNEFDHRRDLAGSLDANGAAVLIPGTGYSAFIRSRDLENDEVEVKLVLRGASWLKTTLKYQLTSLDYTTVTASDMIQIFDTTLNQLVDVRLPGGAILAGNYDAHVYSLSATLTPWRRLYLSSTFSYSDSRMVSGVNNGASLVPYEGDIFSVVSSANFVLNKATDLHASYSFSQADFRQNNAAATLPLGIEYDRHGIIGGVTRRFRDHLTTSLQYGFFRYNEPSFGRINNYTAHAVIATLSLALR